ncbi:MAG: glycoside hydrolase family 92 protein, partial [Bacteroidetes bacterium]|nr:glycoside hydrolase family 92 protein [Bacteroidota bacterium]
YTFPEAQEAYILFDLEFPTEYGFDVLDANIEKVSNTEIEGYVKQRSTSYNEYTVHFVAKVDRPFDSLGSWEGEVVQHNIREVSGDGDMGVFMQYSTDEGEIINLKTGISLVSIEQARKNLEEETAQFGWDFDIVRANAYNTWNDLLSKIEVEGGTETDRVKFYTNLYRSYSARTIWSDVDGKYVDMYENVQQLEDPSSPVYGADAFWNTFWNLNPLWTLVNPDIANSWVMSFMEIYDKGGWLPKGPTGIEYSGIMVASHQIPLMVSAYQKGIRNYDVDRMYEAIKHNQMVQGRPHPGGGYVGNESLQDYLDFGYVPTESRSKYGMGQISNTLEYAYDDWTVAQLAKALGKEQDYNHFMDRASFYKNAFDVSVGYVRPRHADGSWMQNFSPYSSRGFVEGNSWQYTWFVPHDVQGLINLMGISEFNNRLEEGFENSSQSNFNATDDRFADYPINHGNQPNMQAAYLFNYSGKPWLTQKWVREIMENYYSADPYDGWLGDEDQGQMGAWYVMSAMGLFEMRGGAAVRPVYEIGSPVFDKITIHLNTDYYPAEKFVIEARNNSKENVYIQSATLDGEPLEKPWFYHSELVDGGSLILEMGPEPNRQWGSDPEDVPPSMSRDSGR